jgi:DNA-binding MarR family transcriptional regulator
MESAALVNCTPERTAANLRRRLIVAGKRKFNRIPKTEDLIPQLREAGVGLHVLPTYLCLLDHCNSKTGRAWPSINRMANILGLCRRTVERHMRQLVEAGLVLRNDQQRGRRGRFSTRRYVVVAVLFFRRATVRHGGRTSSRFLYKRRTKSLLNSPTEQISDQDQAHREETIRKRRGQEERIRGYEWLLE